MKYLIKNINQFSDDTLSDFYLKIPRIKRNKIDKYIGKRKRQSIIGEILLKELLESEKIPYDDLDYYYNDYGKPFLRNSDFFFSISHSNDYVICVISNKEIGVDIEQILNTNLNTSKKFASDLEIEYINSNEIDKEKRLFQIFTLKEAYIKMIGKDFNSISCVQFNINDEVHCNKDVTASFINDLDDYVISYVESK